MPLPASEDNLFIGRRIEMLKGPNAIMGLVVGMAVLLIPGLWVRNAGGALDHAEAMPLRLGFVQQLQAEARDSPDAGSWWYLGGDEKFSRILVSRSWRLPKTYSIPLTVRCPAGVETLCTGGLLEFPKETGVRVRISPHLINWKRPADS